MSDMVYLNGRIIPRSEAMVSAFDRGFLYGDGLFETARIVAGVPFRLDRHFARLNASCAALGWEAAPADEGLRRAVAELIARNGVREGYLRVTVSRGEHRGDLTLLAAEAPTVLVDAHAADLHPLDAPPDWVLARSPWRPHRDWPLLRHKTLSYLPYVLALSEGRRRGADEVYFVNADGHVTEGAITNLFFVRGGAVCTAAVECGLLPGITRAAVIELCGRIGLAVREGRFGEGDLLGAEEIFCTNSLRGVVRVRRRLDGGPRDLPPGTVVPALQAAYAALVRSECPAGRPPA